MPNGFGVNAAQLRVLVDAQLPPEPARWLTVTYGLAAQHVQDVDQLSTDDSAIVAAARAGDASIVITKDEGFVKLVERFGPPPQIVKVTCGNIRNADLRALVLSAWPRVADLLARRTDLRGSSAVGAVPKSVFGYTERIMWVAIRTRYFENEVVRKRRYLRREWCIAVVRDPLRVERQADGRYRFWGLVLDFGSRVLRVFRRPTA